MKWLRQNAWERFAWIGGVLTIFAATALMRTVWQELVVIALALTWFSVGSIMTTAGFRRSMQRAQMHFWYCMACRRGIGTNVDGIPACPGCGCEMEQMSAEAARARIQGDDEADAA